MNDGRKSKTSEDIWQEYVRQHSSQGMRESSQREPVETPPPAPNNYTITMNQQMMTGSLDDFRSQLAAAMHNAQSIKVCDWMSGDPILSMDEDCYSQAIPWDAPGRYPDTTAEYLSTIDPGTLAGCVEAAQRLRRVQELLKADDIDGAKKMLGLPSCE